MEVGLLGPLRVAKDGVEIPLRGAKQRALVALLALHRGKPVAAERLVDSVWRGEERANPLNALQAQVSTLRRALGTDGVRTDGSGYSLAVDLDRFDVAAFEALASEGRRLLDAGLFSPASAALRAALGLWRGGALVDFAYEEWASTEIVRLEELRHATIDACIDAELELGRASELVGEIEALLAEDRLREHRWAQLMVAFYRSGRQADALRAAREARATLVEELGVDPGPEIVDLESKILNHDESLARDRAPNLARPLRRLPVALTSFVGRSAELAELLEALQGSAGRLVTLLGPGGAGKTRLAIEAAAKVDVPGGVALVELDTVDDATAVASVVAAAVGVRREAPGDRQLTDDELLDAVAAQLGRSPAIVILDNCEHVVARAATVAEALLTACPSLVILATSREALAVRGERLMPLGPLRPHEAAALFLDRARAVRPDLTLDPASDEVRLICERLDGLPLALELAAARSRALPVAQIAERLAHRFSLLTGGSRTALPRQQTLRAVVDWSYDLLFEDARKLFARLSVFAGGWTLDAAEQVCADDELPSNAVLDILTDLLDKSLVVADPTSGGGLRYRMLQTLREYGADRLEEVTESRAVRDRHADWYRRLALAADPGLTSLAGSEWRKRLDVELPNLWAALSWLMGTGQATAALELADAAALIWFFRGDLSEGLRWAETANAVGGDAPTELRTIVRAWAAFYGAADLDREVSVAAAREAVEVLERGDDLRRLTKARVIRAAVLSRHRDPGFEEAAAAAVETATAHGDPWFLGVALALSALRSVRAGRVDEARERAEQSIELLRSVEDHTVVFEALSVLTTLAQLEGRLDQAEKIVEQMLDHAETAGLPEYQQWTLCRLGFIRTAQGDALSGDDCHCSALEIGSNVWANAHAHLGRAVCAWRMGDYDTARHHIERALDIHSRVGAFSEQAYLHVLAGWVAVGRDDLEEARHQAQKALDTVPPPGDPEPAAMANELLAAVAEAEGDLAGGRRLLEATPAYSNGHPLWWLTRPDVNSVAKRLAEGELAN